MNQPLLRVILGCHAFKAFVAAPGHLRVLGVVRLDLEFGLLAVDADGEFVRVNGSQIQPLDGTAVRRAIHLAQANVRVAPLREYDQVWDRKTSVPRPQITLRKRRALDPSAHLQTQH